MVTTAMASPSGAHLTARASWRTPATEPASRLSAPTSVGAPGVMSPAAPNPGARTAAAGDPALDPAEAGGMRVDDARSRPARTGRMRKSSRSTGALRPARPSRAVRGRADHKPLAATGVPQHATRGRRWICRSRHRARMSTHRTRTPDPRPPLTGPHAGPPAPQPPPTTRAASRRASRPASPAPSRPASPAASPRAGASPAPAASRRHRGRSLRCRTDPSALTHAARIVRALPDGHSRSFSWVPPSRHRRPRVPSTRPRRRSPRSGRSFCRWPGALRCYARSKPPPAPWAAGHRGVDLAAVVGGDVLAPGDGTVTFAGRVAGRPLVTIALEGGLRSTVEPVVPDVAAGDEVAVGDVVGVVAPSGGHCPQTCIHWGVRSGHSALRRCTSTR